MALKMTPIEIVVMKADLEDTLVLLYTLRCIQLNNFASMSSPPKHLMDLSSDIAHRTQKLSLELTRVEGLLSQLERYYPLELHMDGHETASDLSSVEQDQIEREIIRLSTQRRRLTQEQENLPRYKDTLAKLAPLIPPMSKDLETASIGILIDKDNRSVLDTLIEKIGEITGHAEHALSTDVDDQLIAALLVLPGAFVDEVETLLGVEGVARLRLPEGYDDQSPGTAFEALNQRLKDIPEELQALDKEFKARAHVWAPALCVHRDTLQQRLVSLQARQNLEETYYTAVITGWVPTRELSNLQAVLQEQLGNRFVFHTLDLPADAYTMAPVAFDNPTPVRPFEKLVAMLSLPDYDGIDPSSLMAFFLPLFFGIMLGDIGYGAVILLGSLVAAHFLRPGMMHDLTRVLSLGSIWAILFGLAYGEFFGTLGEHMGLHALLFDRASPEYTATLLLMCVGIGAAHVLLGVVLGLWTALKDRNRSHILERGGMLAGLLGLFVLAGSLVNLLPEGFMTPGAAILIVGIAIMGSSYGKMGVLLGPIEFVGVIGNILSYLRLAAIGLASVYLAKVANDMAGALGSLIIGIIVAVLIHALNIVLGAFSPMIHALRLQYVEFFRKFYEGGGRPFTPFGST